MTSGLYYMLYEGLGIWPEVGRKPLSFFIDISINIRESEATMFKEYHIHSCEISRYQNNNP